MIWFTADWHLWHENIIEACDRPFTKCRNMHRTIKHNYNELVGENDHVYIIGDVYWKRSVEELERMISGYKGHKHLILGNHDNLKPFDYIEAGFSQVATSLEVDEFTLNHDPVVSYLRPDKPHICGHVHNMYKRCKNVLNVGVDIWDFKPVSIERVRFEFGIN